MYGKRDGCIRGVAAVARDKGNHFLGTRAWKHACIHNVQMLGRASMYKPDDSGTCGFRTVQL